MFVSAELQKSQLKIAFSILSSDIFLTNFMAAWAAFLRKKYVDICTKAKKSQFKQDAIRL